VAGYASEIAAIKGLEIFGGWGYSMEYDMQRYFRDYKQMIFAPIADEMAKNMLGEWMGLPRSF
jgi:acyl-CoA dehydrogenase